MCLIIQRKPNFEISYPKFEAAVLNNPDGYGLSFPDDKGLTVLRSAIKPDPEKLYRLINEELFDKELMIHLRYTTVGDTNLRNSHPFPILEKKTDGVDLRMAHNGTLSKFRTRASKGESDTRCFVREFVRPLFKRLVRGYDTTDILNDKFVKELLEDQLTKSSVLTFLDSEGNSLICNPTGNGGKEEEGWYYSNTYSFNKDHRFPKKPATVTRIGSPSSTKTTGGTVADTNTRLFTERFGIKNKLDLGLLTDETIEEIVKAGEPAVLLIKELLLIQDNLNNDYINLERDYKLLKRYLDQ